MQQYINTKGGTMSSKEFVTDDTLSLTPQDEVEGVKKFLGVRVQTVLTSYYKAKDGTMIESKTLYHRTREGDMPSLPEYKKLSPQEATEIALGSNASESTSDK